jgi:hypothetical protein
MTARLYDLRPFQSAVRQARRAGVDPRIAIREVIAAQQRGEPGHYVAGKYRALAWRPNGAPPPKGAA